MIYIQKSRYDYNSHISFPPPPPICYQKDIVVIQSSFAASINKNSWIQLSIKISHKELFHKGYAMVYNSILNHCTKGRL